MIETCRRHRAHPVRSGLQRGAVPDDRVRCSLSASASAGKPWPAAAYGPRGQERGPDGLLAAAHVYDDVQLPVIFASKHEGRPMSGVVVAGKPPVGGRTKREVAITMIS